MKYNKQFKKGTMPIQPSDENSPLNGTPISSPSKQRKRDSISLGFQSQARPGLAGASDYSRGKRK